MPHIAILGRQPAIGLAELINLYPNKITPIGSSAALIDAEPPYIDRLGGTIKIASLIATTPHQDIIRALSLVADTFTDQAPGKLAVGLSLYGWPTKATEVFAHSLEFKKLLRQKGLSVRIVPGNPMSAAQIYHNRMISHGADIVIVSHQNTLYIGKTISVQDITAYGLRDYSRPARSAKVGMLPPKLAQIMINLANPTPGSVILDPFCGTGVILQEALLMGYEAYGSDISAELISMSKLNLDWLSTKFKYIGKYQLETGDATSFNWSHPFEAVVTEGYLGPALSKMPTPATIAQLKSEAQHLTLKFMANLRAQIDNNVPVAISLPAWRKGNIFERLNIIDQIEALGYTLKQFLPVNQTDLLYARRDQLVGRELIVVRSK